jgi:predicted O-methyltransferase YrrM
VESREPFRENGERSGPQVSPQVSAGFLRKGGLFVTDNVLWSGQVPEKNPSDPKTKAVPEFNQKLYASKEFFTTILPVQDGVAVAVKR